jgi:dCMP deaminase
MNKKRNTKYSVRKTGDIRPTWDEYFLGIADLVSKIAHCGEAGCIREKLNIPSGERHELCRGLHAEQNAFLQAALHGTSLKDAIIYSTTQPCIICAKMVINAGIKEIVIRGDYPDPMARQILREAKVKVRTVK